MRIFNFCYRIPVYMLENPRWKEVHFFSVIDKELKTRTHSEHQNNLIRSVYLMCDVVFRKLIEHVISQPLYNRLAGFSSAARAILWLNAKDCIQARLGQVTLVSVNTRKILVSVFSTARSFFFSAECIVNVATIYHAKVQSSFYNFLLGLSKRLL